MFEKFGEFDSAEEMNRKAAEMLTAGETKGILQLAEENGIEKEDAEDFIDGFASEFASPLMAAMGKLKVESVDLELKGIVNDWKDQIFDLCTEDQEICVAVRKKGKQLKDCMARLIAFSFENKVQISDKIVKATKVKHNGKTEPFRGPLYLGIPSRTQVKQIVKDYYLG